MSWAIVAVDIDVGADMGFASTQVVAGSIAVSVAGWESASSAVAEGGTDTELVHTRTAQAAHSHSC